MTFALTVQVHEGVGEGVNEGVNSLFDYISNNPGQRVPDFSRGLAVPAKTIERWLKQLRTGFQRATQDRGVLLCGEVNPQRRKWFMVLVLTSDFIRPYPVKKRLKSWF